MVFKVFLTESGGSEMLTHVLVTSDAVSCISSRRRGIISLPRLTGQLILVCATRFGLRCVIFLLSYITSSLSLIKLNVSLNVINIGNQTYSIKSFLFPCL